MTATSLNSSGTAPALPADCQTGVLGFFHTLERLKTNKRTGWVNQGIQKPESIADHMYRYALRLTERAHVRDRLIVYSGYRMAMMCLAFPETESLDISK